MDYITLKQHIKNKALELGFLDINISKPYIKPEAQAKFCQWLNKNMHGDMYYLNRNQNLRFNPNLLVPDTLSIISVKMPYLKHEINFHKSRQKNTNQAYISSYAIGRDYHKVVKQTLVKLANYINEYLAQQSTSSHIYRAFTDSAPIMEIELATQCGSGWRGKNTLLINKDFGSMFFLGEIFTNLPLPTDEEITSYCGSCKRCLKICPTNAFDDAYQLDARKCISYLTIENHGVIPIQFRKLIGNRIYGCDDCQLYCPWNKFAQISKHVDFEERHNLTSQTLLELFMWSEQEFNTKMQGSPILRIGYERWQRNLAVGLGNAYYSQDIYNILLSSKQKSSPLVAEHIQWALEQQINNQQ